MLPQSSLTKDQIRFFHENGYLILSPGLETAELTALQSATSEIVVHGTSRVRDEPDYHYAGGHSSGKSILHRVDYVIDKCDECKALLGNPFLLRSTEQLMGKDLIPTWDAVVLKMPGEGIIVPWHRDAGTDCVGDQPIFNVDYYLDEADKDTCVWVVPGSHLWEPDRIDTWLSEHASTDKNRADFERSDATPAIMQPGDIMFHNILVLHGSPHNVSENLRRVIYYEFRTAHVEERLGPHTPEYTPLKQKVLHACIHRRKSAKYISPDEVPYVYDPPAPYNRTKLTAGEEPRTYRIPHGEHWRPGRWTPRLSLDLTPVTSCRVSPDGEKARFTTVSFVMEDEVSEQRSRIWLSGRGEPRPLTAADVSSSNPRWSPDGNSIAFTSKRGEHTALYVLPVEGGEAVKLTDLKSDVSEHRWSPNGEWIAFLSSDPPSEADEKRKKAKDDWRWENEELKYSRLAMLPVSEDTAGKRDPVTLSPPGVHVTGLNWSPESNEIAYDHMPHPLADYWTKSAISCVNVLTGEVRPLFSGGAAAFGPVYSRDGKEIAFTMSSDPPRWSFDAQIHTIPRAGGTPRPMDTTHERGPGILGWSASDDAILYTEAAGTTTGIYSANRLTGEVALLHLPDGAIMDAALNDSGTHLGIALQRVDAAGEGFVSSVADIGLTQISKANMPAPSVPIAKTEHLRWNSPDGLEIEGLLTYPTGYKSGTRVPLLLIVHGGPAGVFMQTFIGNPGVYVTAAFAAQGYAVLRCNPRGSSGYGEPFRSANRKDWGGGDYRDLMAGVDKVIEMGVANPERMGVMGWSYGGFMTSWIITQTNRFKAASVGAGVTNLMSFNGTADIPSFIPDYFEAQSWENLELYRDHSPMFQVGSVQTSTLIVHGEADIRVPISQGYELYNALRQRGVETRMLVLPRQPHGPNEPKLMLKNMQANLEWFLKYV
jgi:dipeptidyl aminopeptidase/acylaminoacyl peptidase/ectoine hydroxylase-related dioxygenase (phytanoyl-CoA dioxygenase family)